ncbi:MAG: hypothetical protein JNK85_03020 [Verrucomicrobiales bacterium]|nr:hypothetical protein [Verrucomicrobiales bacterium]
MGPIYGLQVTNGIAYAAAASGGLILIDVADPRRMSRLGGRVTRGPVYDVVVRGTTAFVADWGEGLSVFDVANPREPVLLGTSGARTYSCGIALEGDVLALSDYRGNLSLFDVFDARNPKTLSGNYFFSAYNDRGNVVLADGFSFSVGGETNLVVTDCRDPLRLSKLGFSGLGSATGVAVAGDSLFNVDPDRGLRIFDRTKLPSRLPLIGSLKTTAAPSAVATDGSLVCVGEGWDGLEIIDARQPTDPKLIAAVGTDGEVSALTLDSHNRLYVGQAGAPLQIWDLTSPASPSLLGSLDISGIAYGIDRAGDFVFLADGGAGLRVFNVRDPARPQLVGVLAGLGHVDRVVVSENRAILAARQRGVHVVDVSDPTRPRLMATYDSPGYAFDVAAAGNLVYIADFTGGLRVLDVGTPEAPRLVGTWTNAEPFGVALKDNLALVTTQSRTWVVDISDPTQPKPLGPGLSVGGNDAIIVGNLAYCYGGLLSIFDISNPLSPVLLSQTVASGCQQMVVKGTRAFAAMSPPSIAEFDISVPTKPVRVAEWTGNLSAWGLVLSDDVLFVAMGSGGFVVMKIDEMASTSPKLAMRWDSGAPRLNVTDAGSSPWNIEFSDGLELGAGWSPLTNVVPSGGQAEAIDPNAAAPRRFYRAVQR